MECAETTNSDIIESNPYKARQTAIDTTNESSPNTNTDSMDLSICQTTNCQCFGSEIKDNIDINKCSHLRRMLIAIKYYKLLDLTPNTSNNKIFTSFYSDIYKELINDYQHIISIHSQQYEIIYDKIISNKQYGPCNYHKCKLLYRYYNPMRMTSNTSSLSIDSTALFFADLLDSAHHWIYHLFDCGNRVRKSVITENKIEKDDEDDIKYIDKEFARIKKELKTRREKLNVNMDRFGSGNNKYKLSVNNISTKSDQSGSTSIDLLFEDLDENNIKNTSINKLKDILQIEQYDTDSLGDDVIDSEDIYQQQSNIVNVIGNDEKCIKIIIGFVEDLLSMFSIYVYSLFLSIFVL